MLFQLHLEGQMVSYCDWYGNVDILELCFESIPYDLVVIYKIQNELGKEIQVLIFDGYL